MEVLKETFEDKRKFKIFIRDVSNTLQKSPTKNYKMSEQEAEMSDNGHRWSENCSCHHMGCSCPLLHDQHRQTSEVSDFFRSAKELAVSTFKLVGEVDINSRANTRPATITHGSNIADNNKCDMEIKPPEKIRMPENYNDLIWSIANREQECQKSNNKVSIGSQFREPSSFSLGQPWEFGKELSVLAVRELCQNEHMVPSSIIDTQATNQNSCNRNSNIRNETTLLELPNDHETQHTQDLHSLLKLLNNKQPYRDMTNKNALNDIEIRLFVGMYGITDFCLVLAFEDSVFWLEDHDGVIYLWSRIDDSMIRGGGNLKEALTNYLFHHENLYYVEENTRKLIPIDAYEKEAEEWAKSPETYFYFDATKVSPKHKSKMGREKKQQKKKKNKKKH